ncbi:hypothetical protein PRZ48_009415 [Zasmidium cellare]|uniref:RBR-type E3 ubiquitin transferase n=1 Tax=Zasmidium cellare TaxID=395010 RepID=A0ABR0EBN0_ZASCE|nr:hypothetical protein PRZ48_009415 [Zasmidium cellare]
MAAMTWEGVFADVDPLTMRTIVQMQLEDSEEVAARAKGKQLEDEKTDAQVAMEILAIAILQDGDLIAEAFRQEQQLAQDRELAARLANGEDVPSSTPPGAQSTRPKKMQKKEQKDPWEDQEMLDKVAAIYMQLPPEPKLPEPETVENDESDGTVAESSAWAASRKESRKRPLRVCIACGDEKDFFEVARVPCNHEYCRTCLQDLFTLSMNDEGLFPPRCDNQEIPLESVRFFLPSDIAKEFEAKYDELSTHNRTYCHERSCATFIPNELHEEDTGACPECGKTTCTICKGPSHSGDCPDDEALHQLVEAANAAQWQRCYECSRFVELESGCNHITAAQLVDRNPQRRLFQPARVAHVQPATRPRAPSSTVATVAGPTSSRRRVRPPVPVPRSPSAWESDFSDHSEWEEDWATDDQDELPSAESPESESDEDRTPDGVDEALAVQNTRENRIAEAIEHLRNNHACQHDKWRWVRVPPVPVAGVQSMPKE